MLSNTEQAKKQLMTRRMENMKVEAELSFQEQNFDEAVLKQYQVLKHLVSLNCPSNDVCLHIT
jgi:hypothetical protein